MSRPSIIMSVILALASAFFIEAVYRSNDLPVVPKGHEYALHNLQVLALGMDEYHYQFRDEYGTVFWSHFCHDYLPQFAPGMTLTVLTYQDMGECWSVLNTHPAYLIKRDHKGRIIKEDFNDRPEAAPAAH